MEPQMDLDYRNLTKQQIIRKYQRNLDILRRRARIRDEDFDRLVLEDLSRLVIPRRNAFTRLQTYLCHRRFIVSVLVALLLILVAFYKKEVTAILLRSVQHYIYPFMTLWRKITGPMILFFPSLTHLYDESCLVNNPYFQVDNLNCSPCSSIVNVLDLSNFENVDEINDNVPYMFRTDQRPVTLRHFMDIVHKHREVFEKDAFQVKSTNLAIRNLMDLGTELLNRTNRLESHNTWRCNRMDPARILRQYFPHPKRFRETGRALERFLMFDTPAANAYRVPDTECPNVFMTQVRGNRKIILMPTQECRHECRAISVRLPTSYVLKFNWWYFRPISLPDEMTSSDSVTYVGSYC